MKLFLALFVLSFALMVDNVAGAKKKCDKAEFDDCSKSLIMLPDETFVFPTTLEAMNKRCKCVHQLIYFKLPNNVYLNVSFVFPEKWRHLKSAPKTILKTAYEATRKTPFRCSCTASPRLIRASVRTITAKRFSSPLAPAWIHTRNDWPSYLSSSHETCTALSCTQRQNCEFPLLAGKFYFSKIGDKYLFTKYTLLLFTFFTQQLPSIQARGNPIPDWQMHRLRGARSWITRGQLRTGYPWPFVRW